MPTDFCVNVIATVKRIPRGKVATYAQIAALAGKPGASRGVSWILNSSSKKHKLPWHRVINSRGKISFKKGSPPYRLQRRLLLTERVAFGDDDAVAMAKFQWKKKPMRKRNQPRMFG